jgi:uncharacterized protein YukE
LSDELGATKSILAEKEEEIAALQSNVKSPATESFLKQKEQEADEYAAKYNVLIQENKKIVKKFQSLEQRLALMSKKPATVPITPSNSSDSLSKLSSAAPKLQCTQLAYCIC